MLQLVVGTRRLTFAVGYNCVMLDSAEELRISVGGGSAMTAPDVFDTGTETNGNNIIMYYFYDALASNSIIPVFERSSTRGVESPHFHGYFRVASIQRGPLNRHILQQRFMSNGLGMYYEEPAAQPSYATFLSAAEYEVVLVPVLDGLDCNHL